MPPPLRQPIAGDGHVLPGDSPVAIVGRQPIYDRRLRVYGYELLFRAADEGERAVAISGESCSARVLVNTFMEIGLDNVVGSAQAFVNVNRAFLLSDVIGTLPADRVVLEVLEDTTPDADVLSALRALKAAGYTLALDDFIYRPELEPFLDLASIVKLEWLPNTRHELPDQLRRLRAKGMLVVIERVEEHADLEVCKEMGFDFYQGYFLAKPALVRQSRAPGANRVAALQTLALLADPNATIAQLESAIGGDVALSYRLLRVINSAAFGLSGRVDSLRQAVLFLGRDRIRSWVSLLVLSGLSDKPRDLMTTAMTRARMCEQLADHIDVGQRSAYFTAGLFSILDAVLDTPMDQLLASLPLTLPVTEALLDRTGPIGEVLDVVVSSERCEWTGSARGPLTCARVREAYLGAVRWSTQMNGTLAAA